MASQKDFPSLVEAMKGENTVGGYDVLVSYSQDKINELLQARSRELGNILDTGEIRATGKIIGIGTYDMTVSAKLNHPRLQFEDEYGNITLAFGVQKGEIVNHRDNDSKDELTSDLEFQFKTTLTNVTGTVEGGFAKSGATTTPAHRQVILNPEEKNVAQGVCITFEKATFNIISLTGGDTSGLAVVKEALQRYFVQEADLQYYVAGVSNQYHESPGSHLLRPVSFSFSTLVGKTEKDASALCMWIGVATPTDGEAIPQGGGRSDTPFHESGLIPIPSGCTCSMVIKNDVLARRLILPGLSNGFNGLENKTDRTKGGLAVTGNMKASDVVVPKFHDDQPVDPAGKQVTDVDEIRFSPGDPETLITFDSNINAQSNKMEYSSKQMHVHWSQETITPGKGTIPERGYVTFNFSWAANGSWKDKANPGHPNLLGFDWISEKYWTIPVAEDDRDIIRKLFGPTAEFPDQYKHLQVHSPQVNLEMNTLDYFLTTNLLYPGKHIFDADDPSAETTKKGLALPYDLILTGQTITS